MVKPICIVFSLLFCLSTSLWGQERLEDYLSVAEKNSSLLNSKRNSIASAVVDSSLVRAGYKPQVGFSVDGVYNPIVNGIGHDEVITNKQTGSALVHFDMLLQGKRQLKAQNNNTLLDRQVLTLDYSLSLKELKQQVTAQYLVVFGDQQQLNYVRKTYELLQREDSLLRRLTQANIYRQTDYLTFVASKRRQLLLSLQALTLLKSDLGQLRYMCGIGDTTLVQVANPNLSIISLQHADHTLLMQKYTVDSLFTASQHGLIDVQYQPKLSLHADAGYLSSFLFRPYQNVGVGVGVSFSVPIYDGKQRMMQHQKVMLEEQSLSFEKHAVSHQQQLQIQLLRGQLSDLSVQAKEVDGQLSNAKALVEANRLLLESGQVDIPLFFMAIQNYLDLEGQMSSTEVHRYMLINELNSISE